MATIEINVDEDVLEQLRNDAAAAGQDVADFAGQGLKVYLLTLNVDHSTEDSHQLAETKRKIDKSLRDDRPGRPLGEVFDELEQKLRSRHLAR